MAVILFLNNNDKYLYKGDIPTLMKALCERDILTCADIAAPNIKVYIMTKNIIYFINKNDYDKECDQGDEMIPASWIKKKEQELRNMGLKKMNTGIVIEANTLESLINAWEKEGKEAYEN